MRSHAFEIVFVACACSVACGSSSQTSVNTGDAGGDAGADAGADGGLDANSIEDAPSVEASIDAQPDAIAEAGMDTSTDAAPCGWSPFDQGLSGASIVDVLFDTRVTPPVLYATGGSRIFSSSDSGQTWQTQGAFAGGNIGYLAAPANAMGVLLATSTAGVIKSADSGKTWSVLSLGDLGTDSIGVSVSQPLRVYAAVSGAGVLRSDDGGGSWASMNQGYPAAQTFGLDVAPDNADDVVTGIQSLNAQGGTSSTGAILRTTDGGQSWQTVASSGGATWAVRRCPADPTVLYAATTSGVAYTTNRGATWTLTTLPNLAEDVAINPTNCKDVYAISLFDGPRHSTDGGQTFGTPLTQGLGLVPQGTWPGRIVADPQHAGSLLVGSHGGVWYSTNGGAQWNAAQGLLGLFVRDMQTTPLAPSALWMASWGSGVWQRASSTAAWQRVPTSSLPIDYALTAAPDPKTANRIFVGTSSSLYQSGDGTTFTADSTPMADQFGVAYDPNNTSVVYVATQTGGVYKSTNGGSSWATSNGALAAWATAAGMFIDVRSIVVDAANSPTVYIGTNGRGVYKSTDGGGSWASVLAPAAEIGCLVLVQGSPSTLYACVNGNGVQSSTDGGATWSDLSQGLPTQDIEGLVVDGASGSLYATSTAGVYARQGGGSWTGVDTQCLSGAGTPAIVANGGARSLVVSAGGGIYTHPL